MDVRNALAYAAYLILLFVLLIGMSFILAAIPRIVRRIKQGTRVEDATDTWDFIVRHRRYTLLFMLIVVPLVLFFVAIVIWQQFFVLSILIFLVGILRFCTALYALTWSLRVEGDNMRLRTLFRRRAFSIYEIRRAEVRKSRLGGASRMVLYGQMGKLVSVKGGLLGYAALVERLRQRKVSGAEELLL